MSKINKGDLVEIVGTDMRGRVIRPVSFPTSVKYYIEMESGLVRHKTADQLIILEKARPKQSVIKDQLELDL
jgi:hypothetical protein